MGSRSEPVAPPNADHVIAMCNGGIKAMCNGTATVVKDAREPAVSVDIGFTAEPTILPSVDEVVPACPRLIITDTDGEVVDYEEDVFDAASSNGGSDQLDLPTVDASAGMNIHFYYGCDVIKIFKGNYSRDEIRDVAAGVYRYIYPQNQSTLKKFYACVLLS